jgi:hypothetical protein
MGKFFDTNVEADYLNDYLFTRCMEINYDGLWSGHHSIFNTIRWNEGATIPSESEFDTKLVELTAEYKAQAYARSRKAEYPDWDVQLNKIYDDGIDKWKAEMVDPIKAKYPKIPVVD